MGIVKDYGKERGSMRVVVDFFLGIIQLVKIKVHKKKDLQKSLFYSHDVSLSAISDKSLFELTL